MNVEDEEDDYYIGYADKTEVRIRLEASRHFRKFRDTDPSIEEIDLFSEKLRQYFAVQFSKEPTRQQ